MCPIVTEHKACVRIWRPTVSSLSICYMFTVNADKFLKKVGASIIFNIKILLHRPTMEVSVTVLQMHVSN